MSGTLIRSVLWTVLCGLCNDDFGLHGLHMFGHKSEAEGTLREAGWSKTVKHGWICPDCVDERKKG